MFEVRHCETRLTNSEYKRFHRGDLIFGEYDSEIVAIFETEEEAAKYLSGVRCTYDRAIADWIVEEYGYYDEDWAAIVLAEEREKAYVVYDGIVEQYRASSFEQAESYVEQAEREADERNDYINYDICEEYV